MDVTLGGDDLLRPCVIVDAEWAEFHALDRQNKLGKLTISYLLYLGSTYRRREDFSSATTFVDHVKFSP